MTVSVEIDRIVISGRATVEDAEPLLAALLDNPAHSLDVSRLSRAHLAVVQILHAAGRPLLGIPADPFLRDAVLVDLIQIKRNSLPGLPVSFYSSSRIKLWKSVES